jgi:tRNA(fMet)-specific endonuclease VapC
VVAARYLLDTNVLSEPLRPRAHPGVLHRLEVHQAELATAAPVLHELLFGLERLPVSRKREVIRRYIEDLRSSSMPVLPYDDVAAAWHARERARLEAAGRPVAFRDSQIAAIARVHGLVLVTANVGDFEAVSGLEIENWAASTRG